jgi:hypothetical protein
MATMDALNEKMGKGTTPGATGKERPLAPTLREPKPAIYDELGGLMVVYTDEGTATETNLYT